MSNIKVRHLLGLSLLALPMASFAQLNHLSETLNGGLAEKEKKVSLSFRSFDGNEASIYGDLALAYGWSRDINLYLRASGSERKTVGAIRTGGTDVELQMAWRKANLYVALGAALPSTPAQDRVAGTWTIGVAGQEGKSSAFFGATGVTSDDVTLVGAAVALRTPLSEQLSLDASSIFMIRGENTASIGGNLEDQTVLSFALRYQFSDKQTFWVSASNALGGTTGFSMSHRLGAGFGLGAGIEVKF